MKRKFSVISVLILAVCMVFSLVACTGNPSNNGGNNKVVPEPRTREDTRVEAYTAYQADGTLIGDYKTIAAAINAAVATDSFGKDNSVVEYGSYVELDGTVVFQNRNGFAEASDDQFWFYANGTQLEGYDCYDEAMYAGYLKNNKVITHEVTARGSLSKQFHNGYAILQPDGELETEKYAQSWELSSTMDAAVLYLPARLDGISGLSYELDLSNVQIKPNFEGTDDTYAFIGYYAWEDYYVIATGIACNVQTGAWFPFEGSSRDDSFNDVTYNIGDKPLMISNWNEEGGYWVPEYPKLETSIKTIELYDEDNETEYYVDRSVYNFYTADGKLDQTYTVDVDDELIANYFGGVPMNVANTFVFIAGLDVRTPDNACTDYTNGAEFKNLKVTKATAHVPSEDEISDAIYGYIITPEWKGNDYNIVMASGDHEAGILDYAILNTYACAEYTKVDGCDVFSFSYDKDNAPDTALGGKAAELQAKIDSLKDLTADNVLENEDLIAEVAAMFGTDGTVATSSLAQKFYTVLDFSPLKKAQQLFAENAPLSEEATEYKNAFNALPSLLTYDYVGWKTTEEDDAGYLMNDVQDFAALYALYADKMTEDDIARWKHHVNTDDYNMYVDLMNKSTEYFAEGFTITAKAEGSSATQKTFTGEEAFADIAFYLNKIKKGTRWGFEGEPENDDGNYTNGAIVSTQLSSDNNWLPTYHVLFLKARLEEAGYKLPEYMTNLMTLAGASSGMYKDFEYIDTVLTLAANIANGSVRVVDEKVAASVNKVLVGYEAFTEVGLAWNFNNHPDKADFLYRSKAYKLYYGLETETNFAVYLESVMSFLKNRVGATVNETGLGLTEAVVAQDLTISDAAAEVIALFDKTKIHGGAFTEYAAALEKFKALSEKDQTIVELYSDYTELVELLEGNKNALEAVVLTDVAPITVFSKIYFNQDTTTNQLTAKEALNQLSELVCKVQANAKWTYGEDSDNGESNKTLDFDVLTYQGIRVVVLVQYFQKANVALPTYITDGLTAIGYENFLDAYLSVYETARLTSTYAVEGKTVDNMTEADKVVFEKYWGPDYEINGLLKWNWNSGNKFEMYYSTRVAAIVLQYALENATTVGEQFMDAQTKNWIYGDLFDTYEYKGTVYWTHNLKAEAELGGYTYGSLFISDTCWGPYTFVYIDAEGNVCDKAAEGATILTTATDGVEFKEQKFECCVNCPSKVYKTADGKEVFKKYENGSVNYEAEGFVDKYNLPVELTAEELAKVTLVGTVKTYKFYDVMAQWLTAQGYTVNTNGWGYSAAPTAE